ncbi:MAG: methionine--tRNA ligase subunit beta [Phycisphaerae bacterium]|nr:methionine--tRNA ligase subunit beta [Phycisphaerae bacterium]
MADPAPTPKPQITYEDFAKIDLRVARVIHAENHPGADRLLKLQVDDGSGTPRQICSGIRDNYTAEQMVGKLVILVANLAPRVIRGEESRGMLLAGSEPPTAEGAPRRVVVLTPAGDLPPGSIVS